MASLLQSAGHSVLRNEALSSSSPSSFSPGSHGISFASSSGSKSPLHVAWCSGVLTKAVFGDYGGTAAASKYFAGTASLQDLPGCRSISSSSFPFFWAFVFFCEFVAGIFWLTVVLCAQLLVASATERRCFGWQRCYAWCEFWSGAHQATRLGRVSSVFVRMVCLFKCPRRVH